MKTIIVSDEDAAQIKAILLTHAEMTDQQSIKTENEHGRMSRDEPHEVGVIDCLREEIKEFNEDTDNLKRIASLFD